LGFPNCQGSRSGFGYGCCSPTFAEAMAEGTGFKAKANASLRADPGRRKFANSSENRRKPFEDNRATGFGKRGTFVGGIPGRRNFIPGDGGREVSMGGPATAIRRISDYGVKSAPVIPRGAGRRPECRVDRGRDKGSWSGMSLKSFFFFFLGFTFRTRVEEPYWMSDGYGSLGGGPFDARKELPN